MASVTAVTRVRIVSLRSAANPEPASLLSNAGDLFGGCRFNRLNAVGGGHFRTALSHHCANGAVLRLREVDRILHGLSIYIVPCNRMVDAYLRVHLGWRGVLVGFDRDFITGNCLVFLAAQKRNHVKCRASRQCRSHKLNRLGPGLTDRIVDQQTMATSGLYFKLEGIYKCECCLGLNHQFLLPTDPC